MSNLADLRTLNPLLARIALDSQRARAIAAERNRRAAACPCAYADDPGGPLCGP